VSRGEKGHLHLISLRIPRDSRGQFIACRDKAALLVCNAAEYQMSENDYLFVATRFTQQ
jgi:hypothetical protein